MEINSRRKKQSYHISDKGATWSHKLQNKTKNNLNKSGGVMMPKLGGGESY